MWSWQGDPEALQKGSFKILFRNPKVWFPLDHNGNTKSCGSRKFWFITERLITIENKYLNEIGVDLQPKQFLS